MKTGGFEFDKKKTLWFHRWGFLRSPKLYLDVLLHYVAWICVGLYLYQLFRCGFADPALSPCVSAARRSVHVPVSPSSISEPTCRSGGRPLIRDCRENTSQSRVEWEGIPFSLTQWWHRPAHGNIRDAREWTSTALLVKNFTSKCGFCTCKIKYV